MPEVEKALQLAVARGVAGAGPELEKFRVKNESVQKYIRAYQQYCWPVHSLDDYKFAPFHILATEG